MSSSYRPAKSFTERKGAFIALTGGTNSGKTYSALRLARGIAGPDGKVAVLDTEGGRTLHLRDEFDFDAKIMDPAFRPSSFAVEAKGAEDAGYACLLIDSFSMEWVGLGGVLDWQAAELDGMVKRALSRRNEDRPEWKLREAFKMAAWIAPKMDHKQMVYSFLQRRMPIIFSIRGEETIKPGENGEKPQKLFKSICNKDFPFEMTVAFRLAADRKGFIDLADPKSWKMEGAHQAIFRDGDRLSEEHGAKLAAWARGDAAEAAVSQQEPPDAPAETDEAAEFARSLAVRVRACGTEAELRALTAEPDVIDRRAKLRAGRPKLADRIDAVVAEVLDGLSSFPGDRQPAGADA